MLRSVRPVRWSALSIAAVCLISGLAGYKSTATRTLRSDARASENAAGTVAPTFTHPSATAAPGNGAVSVKAPARPDQRWLALSSQESTPLRDRELASLLEALARTDPQHALELAQSEGNWRLRAILRTAALRGWASVAPDAAGDWALTVRPEERRAAVAAVLGGAVNNPDGAVRVALRLCADDPEPAGDYGHAAVESLADAGAFEAAVKFGTEAGADKFPFLLKSAFFQWAQHQPEQALAALGKIADPSLRNQAFGQVAFGWAKADAQALATYALTLPPGENRTRALAEALPHWVEKDPVAAAEWIQQFDLGKDFDAGVASVANLQSLITGRPTVAMTLAADITDPAARAHTMRTVFRQWATNDPAAARRFIEGTTNPQDRATLLAELKDMSP